MDLGYRPPVKGGSCLTMTPWCTAKTGQPSAWTTTLSVTAAPISDLSISCYVLGLSAIDRMVECRAPRVTELPPPAGLNKDHHGPPASGSWLPWSSGAKSNDQSSRPKSFQNPWPSWRSPTLADAYRAYKLGAALAHPEPREPGLTREQSRTEDHPAYHPYKLSDGREVPKLPYEGWYPVSTYVRPPLAEKYEDDEEEDWREPPIKVVTPGWGGMEHGRDKEMVTWLGHATVLVQIPWKGNREGMCGVLFDPIFSQR